MPRGSSSALRDLPRDMTGLGRKEFTHGGESSTSYFGGFGDEVGGSFRNNTGRVRDAHNALNAMEAKDSLTVSVL